MFYSLPVLKEILPNPYLSHYSLLVVGVLLLSSELISPEDIRVARFALNKFYEKFPDLYGKCCVIGVSLNVPYTHTAGI